MEKNHTVLCVDDDRNILNALKRLLRRENYTLLTATGGEEALELLTVHPVQLVICDQRMPGMKGNELLATIRERYPDTIRITLTGYTEVDAITESINRGHIYKFLLKPWNDQNLKIEIRQALQYHDLMQDNRSLNARLMEKNRKLENLNSHLEEMVRERTQELEFRNAALEVSHAVLEELPVPVVGVSAEQMVVLINREARSYFEMDDCVTLGAYVQDCFPETVAELVSAVLTQSTPGTIAFSDTAGREAHIHAMPLRGRFAGMGAVLSIGNTGRKPLPVEAGDPGRKDPGRLDCRMAQRS